MKWWLILLALVAAPLCAQIDVPQTASDPACASGESKMWANTTSHKIKKCENGVTSDMDSAHEGFDTNFGPQGDEYNPDRAPSTSTTLAACTDEFNNGNSATWTWVNQGNATITYTGDFAILKSGAAQTTSTRGVYCVPDNSADWTFTAKVTVSTPSLMTGGGTVQAGLWLIDGGSIATPTTVVGVAVTAFGTSSSVQWETRTGYTGGWSTAGGGQELPGGGIHYAMSPVTFCFQLRYVVGTKVMTFREAPDCRNWSWNSTSTRTFSAHPAALGFFVDNNNIQAVNEIIQWARYRIDSAGNTGEYPPGS